MTVHNTSLLAFLAVIALFYAGCVGSAESTSGTSIERDQVHTIEKGTTTRSEIESTFGNPHSLSKYGSGGTMMVYHHADSKVEYSRWDGKSQNTVYTKALQITLDSNDVVSDVSYQEKQMVTGTMGPQTHEVVYSYP